MGAQEEYKKAYEFHYTKNDAKKAYALYKNIIEKYPTSSEAKYSETQIKNIKKSALYDDSFEAESNAIIRNFESEEKEQREFKEKVKKLPMILTTGSSIDGYQIVKYIDIISAQTVLGTGIISEISVEISDFFGYTSTAFENKIERAKQTTMEKLKKQMEIKGGNALIGVRIDVESFAGNVICVVGSGTVVVAEKLV